MSRGGGNFRGGNQGMGGMNSGRGGGMMSGGRGGGAGGAMNNMGSMGNMGMPSAAMNMMSMMNKTRLRNYMMDILNTGDLESRFCTNARILRKPQCELRPCIQATATFHPGRGTFIQPRKCELENCSATEIVDGSENLHPLSEAGILLYPNKESSSLWLNRVYV